MEQLLVLKTNLADYKYIKKLNVNRLDSITEEQFETEKTQYLDEAVRLGSKKQLRHLVVYFYSQALLLPMKQKIGHSVNSFFNFRML